MMHRFYWLIEDHLAGCSRPGGPEGGRGQQRAAHEIAAQLAQDLAWLRGQGIGAALSLTETPLHPAPLAQHDLVVLHLPVPDLHAPTPDEFSVALRFIDQQMVAGRAVAVHCLAGQGRTGTVLAAYLIRQGTPPDDAIARLRACCPGAIEAAEQAVALHAFAQRRDWVL